MENGLKRSRVRKGNVSGGGLQAERFAWFLCFCLVGGGPLMSPSSPPSIRSGEDLILQLEGLLCSVLQLARELDGMAASLEQRAQTMGSLHDMLSALTNSERDTLVSVGKRPFSA